MIVNTTQAYWHFRQRVLLCDVFYLDHPCYRYMYLTYLKVPTDLLSGSGNLSRNAGCKVELVHVAVLDGKCHMVDGLGVFQRPP